MQGLDVGNCDIMLHVRVCNGLVRQLDGSIEKRFDRKELLYPIQVLKPHCCGFYIEVQSFEYVKEQQTVCKYSVSAQHIGIRHVTACFATLLLFLLEAGTLQNANPSFFITGM